MSGSVNKVILIGNVGADPEIRRTQDGRPIASLRIATSETWRDRTSGERREKTEWHQVVVFVDGLCKLIEQYVKKGSKLYVEGQLQTRKWQDAQGVDRYSTEIVLQGFGAKLEMLDKRQGSGYQAGGNGAADYGLDDDRASFSSGTSTGQSTGQSTGMAGGSYASDLDDDIPFAPEWRG